MSKLQYLAPVAFTTATVTALIAIKIQDEGFKKILRGIAGVLFLASMVSFADEVLKLYERSATAERRIAEERAKTAIATQQALEAQQKSRESIALAEERMRLQLAEQQRLRALAEEEARLAKLRQQEAEAQARTAIAKALSEEQRLRADTAKKEQDEKSRSAEADRIETQRRNAFCESCCRSRATVGNKYDPNTAIGVCTDECRSGRPSNWFGQGAILCKQ